MSRISLGIFDDHRIVQEGIHALLKDIPDFEVVFRVHQAELLGENLKLSHVNILIINLHQNSSSMFDLIFRLGRENQSTKFLILSAIQEENVVFRSIKAGAKGFLAADSSREEFIEAIYTLRNGHDYFSHSITRVLINHYIQNIKEAESKVISRELSAREMEIMKLWGNSYTNREIADSLYLSVRTVETHKNHIMQKLNLKTSVDMVKYAIRNNIIEI